MSACNGAGNRAVFVHVEVSGGFIGTAVGPGVGKLPFAAHVAFRRIFGLVRLADFKSAAVDKNKFDLCFFLEEFAVSDDKIRDLPVFYGAEAVRDAEDFRRR